MNERGPRPSVSFLGAGRDEAPLPLQERAREPGDEVTYVTADVAKRDRLESERLALIGFLHVGV
jgi:hypothetical protein